MKKRVLWVVLSIVVLLIVAGMVPTMFLRIKMNNLKLPEGTVFVTKPRAEFNDECWLHLHAEASIYNPSMTVDELSDYILKNNQDFVIPLKVRDYDACDYSDTCMPMCDKSYYELDPAERVHYANIYCSHRFR